MMNRLESVRTFLIGVFMGFASLIPGFSAATVLLLAGKYEKFVRSASRTIEGLYSRIWGGSNDLSVISQINILTLIFAGAVLGLFIFSTFIETMFLSFPTLVYALFSGVLIATAGILFAENLNFCPRTILLSLVGFALGVLMYVGTGLVGEGSVIILYFISGFVVGIALMVPGMSGSAVLLLFGNYQDLLSQLNDFLSLRFLANGFAEFSTLLIFGLGLLTGFVGGSLSIKRLLNHYLADYLAFVSGLVLSAGLTSLLQAGISSVSGFTILRIFLVLLGILLVWFVERNYSSLSRFSSNPVS